MYAARRWSVRHARALERIYGSLEAMLRRLGAAWPSLAHDRLARPTAALEASVKGFLFDCRMCGQCILSETGMACPMNCPKALRNGPCGGVRADGGCEIEPAMRCVWVEAWSGSRLSVAPRAIVAVQKPLDHRLAGTSLWLRVMREGARDSTSDPPGTSP